MNTESKQTIWQLIDRLCPDGVPYRKLGEVCKYIRGVTYDKSREVQKEDEPHVKVLRANNIDLNSNTLCFEDVKLISAKVSIKQTQWLKKGDILICAGSGSKEHIGKVAYIFEDIDYSFGGFMAVVRCSSVLDTRFLFHCLTSTSFHDYLLTSLNSSTINNLNSSVMNAFSIPVPPPEVQREVVRILDEFNAATATLLSLLGEELTARRKQYAFYRDCLLAFGEGARGGSSGARLPPAIARMVARACPDGVPYRRLGEVFTRLRGTPITAAKMKQIASPDGEIRVFAGGKTVIDAHEQDIPNANITRVPAVLVQSRGIIDAVYYDKPFTFKNEMWAYTADDRDSVKYLYYVLQSNIHVFRAAASAMGSLPQISLAVTENFSIPIPPLEVQREVVRILDEFSTLTTSLTSGLPAEIAARQKQYEYYRDKLLSFKRKG